MAPPLSSVVRHRINQILGPTVVHVCASQRCIPLLGLLADYSFRFVWWSSCIQQTIVLRRYGQSWTKSVGVIACSIDVVVLLLFLLMTQRPIVCAVPCTKTTCRVVGTGSTDSHRQIPIRLSFLHEWMLNIGGLRNCNWSLGAPSTSVIMYQFKAQPCKPVAVVSVHSV